MGATGELAHWATETASAQVPDSIIHEGKRCLINFLSVALYSSRDPSLDIAAPRSGHRPRRDTGR